MTTGDLTTASTTGKLTPARSPRLSDRTWQLTGMAGALQLGGLAIVLAGGSLAVVAALTAAAGVLLGGYALAPRAIAAVRRSRGWIMFAVLLLAASVWVAVTVAQISTTNLGRPLYLGLAPPAPFWARPTVPSVVGRAPLLAGILLTAALGLVLVADAVRVWLGYAPHQRAPWKQMTEPRPRSSGIAWRGLAGVLLTGCAAFLSIGLAGRYVAGNHALQIVALLAVAVAAAFVIGTPVAIGSLMRVDRDKAGSARERERQRFAAHLHDSVLQTLALVQRQAHDPVAVARLARRQEYALRAWMAGEAELLSETLVAALRDVVGIVEDEHEITIELTAIGDRPLDPAGEALVAAAREALRNAARHAGGARVFVFAEISSGAVDVFIRDDGPGFDPDAVPAERRGIRDAIVGRMASAGGLATVESRPGEGTEVALRICAGRVGR
jgi:signal transduction histidine kinase